MTNSTVKLDSLLNLELAFRGKSAALSNSIFAVFIYFYYFGIAEHKGAVQGLAVMMLFLGLTRYYLSSQFLKSPKNTATSLKLTIILNSLTLSSIVSFALWELDLAGADFAILGCLVAGMTAGSIISLSYDQKLFLLHVGSMLGSLSLLSLFKYSYGNHPEGLKLSFIIIAYFFYLYFQYKNFNRQTLEKFSYQKKLEKSYEEIQKSTQKLIQASRFEALGDMAQGLAHVFNNSTMVILGSAQQVEREL